MPLHLPPPSDQGKPAVTEGGPRVDPTPARPAGWSSTVDGKLRMNTHHLRDQPRPSSAGKHLAGPKIAGAGTVIDPIPAEPLEWLDDADWLDELLDGDN